MKMSPCYIHSEVLLFYSNVWKRNEREKKLGRKKTQYLENWGCFSALAVSMVYLQCDFQNVKHLGFIWDPGHHRYHQAGEVRVYHELGGALVIE